MHRQHPSLLGSKGQEQHSGPAVVAGVNPGIPGSAVSPVSAGEKHGKHKLKTIVTIGALSIAAGIAGVSVLNNHLSHVHYNNSVTATGKVGGWAESVSPVLAQIVGDEESAEDFAAVAYPRVTSAVVPGTTREVNLFYNSKQEQVLGAITLALGGGISGTDATLTQSRYNVDMSDLELRGWVPPIGTSAQELQALALAVDINQAYADTQTGKANGGSQQPGTEQFVGTYARQLALAKGDSTAAAEEYGAIAVALDTSWHDEQPIKLITALTQNPIADSWQAQQFRVLGQLEQRSTPGA